MVAQSSPLSRTHPTPTGTHLPVTYLAQHVITTQRAPTQRSLVLSTAEHRQAEPGTFTLAYSYRALQGQLLLLPCNSDRRRHFPKTLMRCSLAVSAVTGDSGGWVPRDSRPHAAKTRLSQPPKAGGFNGNLGCGLPGSKREDCQSARNNKESLQMQQTTAAAGFAPIIAHPDAMRRRQAAERR